MTLYLQTYPNTHLQRRSRHPMTRPWVGNDQRTLGVNIREEDENFVLFALVPGLNAEDLNIQILDDVVRIDGQYKQDDESQYLMQELPYGSFTRTLRLPSSIEADSVEAKIKDGVLTLTLPKAESSRPKKISIKTK